MENCVPSNCILHFHFCSSGQYLMYMKPKTPRVPSRVLRLCGGLCSASCWLGPRRGLAGHAPLLHSFLQQLPSSASVVRCAHFLSASRLRANWSVPRGCFLGFQLDSLLFELRQNTRNRTRGPPYQHGAEMWRTETHAKRQGHRTRMRTF